MRKNSWIFFVGGIGIIDAIMLATQNVDVFTAIIAFVSVVEICVGCSVRSYNRGYKMHISKNYKEAVDCYNNVISLNPLFASAYNNRGVIRAEWKEYDLALADYTRAIKIKPRNSNVYVNRGIVFLEKNDYMKSIADFDRAIFLNNKHAEAYLKKGEAYEAQMLTKEAVQVYQSLLENIVSDESAIRKAKDRIKEIGFDLKQ